jgi:hypothetical protein
MTFFCRSSRLQREWSLRSERKSGITGSRGMSSNLDGATLAWGLAKWTLQFVDPLLDAPMDMADFECKQILGERYHRVQVDLPRKVEPDDQGEIGFLEQVAGSEEVQGLIGGAVGWGAKTGYFQNCYLAGI